MFPSIVGIISSRANINFYKDVILSQTPLGYWRLSELTGSVVDNIVGDSAKDASIVGSPTKGVTGLVNNNEGDTCFTFNNSSNTDYLQIPYGTWLNTSAISVSFWMKATSFSNKEIISRAEISNQYSWSIRLAVGSVIRSSMWTCSSSIYREINTPISYSTGTIYHIVITMTNSLTAIYVNGTLATSSSSISGTWCTSSTSALRVAGIGPSTGLGFNFYDGDLDEIAYWDRELTSSEILAQYNAGK